MTKAATTSGLTPIAWWAAVDEGGADLQRAIASLKQHAQGHKGVNCAN